jgi:hypothetical protein
MTCVSCGATIADKAIVCYRCGAPTATPAPRSTPPASGVRPATVASGILAAALGTMTFLVPDDSVSQLVAGAGAVVSALGTGWLWLRRRR